MTEEKPNQREQMKKQYGDDQPVISTYVYRCNPPVGTEELAHMEIVSAIIYQLTRNLNVEDLHKGGFDAYYIDHTTGVYPVNASGVPFSALTFQSTGDAIADLHEDLAADGTTS